MSKGLVYINTAVDSVTGEVKNKKIKKKVYFDEQQGYLFFSQKNGARTFEGIDLPEDLSDSEIAKVYRLSRKIYKNSNMLAYRTGNNIRAMEIKHIAKSINMSERCCTIFINKMIRKRILAKAIVEIGNVRQIQFYMNPIYFFNGKWLSLNLYLLFKSDLDFLLPEWVKLKFNDSDIKR